MIVLKWVLKNYLAKGLVFNCNMIIDESGGKSADLTVTVEYIIEEYIIEEYIKWDNMA